jgi:hypothetical protein
MQAYYEIETQIPQNHQLQSRRSGKALSLPDNSDSSLYCEDMNLRVLAGEACTPA